MAFYFFVYTFCLYPIKCCNITVKHHTLSANYMDKILNVNKFIHCYYIYNCKSKKKI